ncbi:MAG: DUF6519 domain-containing protein [Enhygromyxa sp.]
MANLEITRHRAAPHFHYTGARMQQGRTLLDSDWNEDALLTAEDHRLTLVDLIGAQGSSNNGFNVTNVRAVIPTDSTDMFAPHIDFDVQPGSMFVGGLRFVVDSSESFMAQADWLRHALDESPAEPPTLSELGPDLAANYGLEALAAAPKYRHDLVILIGWEQPVTAVEDGELRERALGGPDSSARIRRVRRIRVAHDAGDGDPMQTIASLAPTINATFDIETAELVSNARLTVTPIAPAGELPCGPQPPSGYVGHEDQAIRVELRGGNSITWGFGDAAPLYRVTVGAGGDRITFLNKPRDASRRPKPQQIVEVIPWGAKLPNQEKIADLHGQLFRVESYDAAAGELVLAGGVGDGVPHAWTQWLESHRDDWSSRDGDDGGYFYLRVWDRGADTSSPPLIELGDEPVELGKTGLQVSLEGLGDSGDYWVIAARRATPDRVVPWQLLDSERPHGPRRFAAPLALIRWEAPLRLMSPAQLAELNPSEYQSLVISDNLRAVWGPVTGVPIDARRRLQRLCLGGGCTITVGDGTTTHGLVDSLGDALALLPSAGGRICLLQGQHVVQGLVIDGRQNIEICGVGALSMLVNPDEVALGPEFTNVGDPLLTLRDCSNIILRDLMIIADARVGVKIHGANSQCEDISIQRVWFIQGGRYEGGIEPGFALPQPAVLALGGRRITVRNCDVGVNGTLSYAGALVLGGEQLRILDNHVQGGDFEDAVVARCMGGIHVLSQSVDVEVAGNTIHGGWGFGVALGHVLAWDEAPEVPEVITMADIWAAAERGLGEPVSDMLQHAPDIDAPIGSPGINRGWTSAGALVDVRIDRNHISGMGLSGISTSMMGLGATGGVRGMGSAPAFLVICKLTVTSNMVVGNRRISSFPSLTSDDVLPMGGIVIAAAIDATVAENHVIGNGADSSDAPICGLAFLAMQNLVIRDNCVAENGPPGFLGVSVGIVAYEVTGLRGATYVDTIHANISLEQQPEYSVKPGKLALQVHKNEVVQRSGPALFVVRGFDDIVVTENSLSSQDAIVNVGGGDGLDLVYEKGIKEVIRDAGGGCVRLYGLSLPADLDWGSSIPTPPGIMLVDPGAAATVGGTVLFSGNRGELDWDIQGGYGSAFLISSLDSVVVADNLLVANLHGGEGAFDEAFLNGLVDDPSNKSFVITNCYVGSIGGALVRGNRFVEDQRGALLSVIVGPPVGAPFEAEAARLGVAMTSCVGTHCKVVLGTSGGDVAANNIALIKKPTTAGPGCAYTTDFVVDGNLQVKITY